MAQAHRLRPSPLPQPRLWRLRDRQLQRLRRPLYDNVIIDRAWPDSQGDQH
jgi:hypothetical protein